MEYLLVPGEGPPLRVHSRCEDELLAKAELLLFAEDAAKAYPGRPVVGTYDVEPALTIANLKRAYRYDHAGYRRLGFAYFPVLSGRSPVCEPRHLLFDALLL